MNVADYFDSMSYGPSTEEDTLARQWLAANKASFGHFIGGKFTNPKKSESFETFEPATGKSLARIAMGTKADVDAAVHAARKAQKDWAGRSGHERARSMYALARIIQRNARLIAVVESLDNGKPIRESRDIDIPLAARHFYYHAGWAQLSESEFSDHSPVGVVGQIIPWNFPFLMLAWKLAPALALGNAVVLKPAEATSLTALLFAELALAAGLPDGLINVVTGDGSTGALVVEHEDIDKIAFTGSTQIGKVIRKVTAGTGKSLTLELGGKSPFIVFEDADIDAAIEGVVDAIWLNQGQVCCAGSRILVQEGIADDFHDRLRARMAKLRVGVSLDKTIDISSIIDPDQLKRVTDMVNDGVSAGATIFQPEIDFPQCGSFYPPTLLTNVQSTSAVATEEIFGPVVVSMTFRTTDEAILLANHSRYGLSASIWSESVNQSLEVAAKVEAGIVWINSTNLMDAAVGFGGRKESGFGREGGREGCFEYLKPDVLAKLPARPAPDAVKPSGEFKLATIDQTAKMFIGGKQQRPDATYSKTVYSPKGTAVGEVGLGNRKDIRNAVEAARKASAWGSKTAYNRSQILFYLGENLSTRSHEFADRLRDMTGASAAKAKSEVELSVSRLFSYAAWADKFEGQIHMPPMRGLALAIPEPLGVVGAICPPEAPLLGLISVVAPLLAVGNRVVVVPSEPHPLSATDFYSVVETSDVPDGVLNIVTGDSEALADVLSKHNDVDAVWAFGSAELSKMVEQNSIGNLKRTFVDYGRQIDWSLPAASEGEIYLRKSTEVKNIWVPYGE